MQGQAVCSYYSMYGLCKYGPTCKFDHPPMSNLYNYGLSLPAMLDSPYLSYPRGSSAPHVPETSHSLPSKSFDVVHNKPLSNKNQNSDSRLSDDSAKQASSLAHSPPSSEASEDQSG